MNPDERELLSLILRPAGRGQKVATVEERVREKAQPRPEFDEWLQALQSFLPADADEELTDYLRHALMGVVVGFGDRNLSPYLDQHRAIIPPLLADIGAVYGQAKAAGAEYSREGFRFRAYDYGIHKAYYLDWSLYLSRDLY